tara:strand:- start:87 stop:347 length:261 start_codon:yes stop_codon:yes gene_type:complete
MNVDSDKPKFIEARYSAYLSWDLEDLGIDWDKVEDWDLQRADLHITFKDGTEKVYEQWEDLNIDYKHNFEEVLILDEGWHKVEGLN